MYRHNNNIYYIILEKYEQIIDGRPAHAVTTQKPGVTFRLAVESSFGVAVSDTARGQGYDRVVLRVGCSALA